jgi:RNA polymerase sigma-70 factor (ECF subfamily)
MEVVTYNEPQADHSDFKDLKRILERALESISEPQRNSIMLRDYEGYSYQEIGEIMQMSESQVKINIFRGRKNLQQILGNMEDYL